MSRPSPEGAATPATAVLARAGVKHTVRAYEHDPAVSADLGFGAEAALALGVEPGRVLKTLLASLDGHLVVAVIPVDTRLDLKALAAAMGGKRAEMAPPEQAERSTGYVVGGISPLGQRRRLPTVIDAGALAHPTVVVSAGRRGLDVELSPHDLLTLTGATTAVVSR